MASVTTRPNGHRWVQYADFGGKRQTIRLGAVSASQARGFKDRVERLLAATAMETAVDLETAKWLGRLPQKLYSKLARAGLVEPREASTVGDLLREFRTSLNVKPSTLRTIERTIVALKRFFGDARRLASVTRGDAKEFRSWLATAGHELEGGLFRTTVSRRCRRARQIFRFAVDKRWIAENPFAVLKGGSEVNRSRDFRVTPEIIQAVLAEIPSLQFRGIVVLARYGGLRCPSEILPLRWDAVNWEHQTLRVLSSKTEEHESGERLVPLFPEVQDALAILWEHAPDGATLVFPSHQHTGTSLTNRLEDACRRAGIPLWPKPWQNMRSTRENELAEEYPIQAVADWIGHSPKVALKHYLQVSKEHHARAVNLRKSVLRPSGDEINRSKKRSTVSGRSESPRLDTTTEMPENTKKGGRIESPRVGKATRQGL